MRRRLTPDEDKRYMRNGRFGMILSLLLLPGSGALAQATTPQILSGQVPRTYDVKTITFDSWCEGTQQYASDRCARRLAADVKAFELYRDSVERYELQYLKQVEQNRAAEQRGNRDPTQTERAIQDKPIR